ncbi:hypothetical protein [Lacticaseibacillus camelliae]|uniref:Uncharacterized protein n=1 Tax=Lacticaseibacillus camelliae DSM 22697 = JCM 13995 TaxID=1423730 RepID=A0A0R2FAH1_9LACO|nr:hypothetical protein [Lacticaseibacillus camelliae]KRN25369.1 hypothetical protein FC75_GL000639 [Lacticaseibacillus camelliae DSM 22697 = JCM 13995]
MTTENASQFFPTNRDEAIALEWLRQQDLSDKSPEDVALLFDTALKGVQRKNEQLHENK